MSDPQPGAGIPWARIAAEGGAIVISILLAFWIDAAWGARQERLRELDILQSLAGEFETNRDMLPRFAEAHRRTASAAEAAVATLRGGDLGGTVQVADTILAYTVLYLTFEPESGALDAVLQAGDLSVISDPRLRRLLAGWPAEVADATENQSLLSGRVRPVLEGVLMRELDIGRLLELFGGDHSLTTGLGSQGDVAVTSTTELVSLLSQVRVWADEGAREQTHLASLADSILGRIARELGDAPVP